MTDLVDFLKARLDEDEQTARSGFSHPERWVRVPPGIPNGLSCSAVLAEVEAKRKIIEEHSPHERYATECRTCGCPDSCGCAGGVDFPCDTLKALAMPYASHPDYREEWRS